jgi:hypothetical protein
MSQTEFDVLIIFGIFFLLLDFVIYFDAGVWALRMVRALSSDPLNCDSYFSL